MDQSCGKPLTERMSREMTSSDAPPPPPPRPLRAPEPGTRRLGTGGGNGLAFHVGPTYIRCELDCWRRYKTFGYDLNSKFFLYYYEESLVKKSKCKRKIKDWVERYKSILLVMIHYVWFMMLPMLFSVQLYIL
jgi:hypothetical protein